MKTITHIDKVPAGAERGAALVSVLLISALLLCAGGMLLLTTTMAGTNTIDAAAETQAYYGAEAGIEATLNVLRGNVLPNPLFVTNPPGTVAPQNRIDFTKALQASTSNLAGDPSSPKRLSRWLTYNYPTTGATDRIAIHSGYTPFNGIAYSIKVSDPDGTDLTKKKPLRLMVESTGYGPRGARKTLYALLNANSLNIEIPAPLVLRGHDNGSTNLFIDLGNSNSKTYSGADNAALESAKPTIAINAHDVTKVQEAYEDKPNTVADEKFVVLDLPGEPYPGGIKPPWFLETANNARAFLVQAAALANSCVAPGNPPGSPCIKKGVILDSLNGTAGSTTNQQFTIVNGDCHLDGGAGLLIVLGTLYFDGPGPNFDGVILVLGEGRVIKQGGGNRDIFGSIMLARFGATGGFLEPSFNYNGGAGNSNLQFDSRAVLHSVVLAGVEVVGVVEK